MKPRLGTRSSAQHGSRDDVDGTLDKELQIRNPAGHDSKAFPLQPFAPVAVLRLRWPCIPRPTWAFACVSEARRPMPCLAGCRQELLEQPRIAVIAMTVPSRTEEHRSGWWRVLEPLCRTVQGARPITGLPATEATSPINLLPATGFIVITFGFGMQLPTRWRSTCSI
ncbi:hypothetical protein S40293_11462 [Stachybotrys chartarum IBT 40293]|nr:hypothetical protein S40293_11462 [Stachybotrys chartarum IBT 40293]